MYKGRLSQRGASLIEGLLVLILLMTAGLLFAAFIFPNIITANKEAFAIRAVESAAMKASSMPPTVEIGPSGMQQLSDVAAFNSALAEYAAAIEQNSLPDEEDYGCVCFYEVDSNNNNGSPSVCLKSNQDDCLSSVSSSLDIPPSLLSSAAKAFYISLNVVRNGEVEATTFVNANSTRVSADAAAGGQWAATSGGTSGGGSSGGGNGNGGNGNGGNGGGGAGPMNGNSGISPGGGPLM
ncbi:MAG: hypothetical protein D6780_08305 [Candidatus Dadabacteria bacterium]|nr:MAG: hypothetical protein D6780_08305 [Candidatus Dadabacteria bacterium]